MMSATSGIVDTVLNTCGIICVVSITALVCGLVVFALAGLYALIRGY